jgi:PAS domain S-box-containing protein
MDERMRGEADSGRGLASSLSGLRPHDHLCLIYDSREEQLGAVVPFLRQGIEEERDRCLYVADSRSVADLGAAMRDGGLDADAAMRRGALAVATERETYLAGGEFDPDRMLALAQGAAAQAVADGFRALRIGGEMSWALGDDTNLRRLMEYEVGVNHRILETPALAVCQYDRRRFSPEIIREVIRTHPLVSVGGRVCRNFYYVPPEELIAADRPMREVDRLLQNILDRERAEDALRASERRLARVLQGSNDAFWEVELAAGVVIHSARWTEITGRGPRQSVAEWKADVHPEDLDALWAAIQEHLAGRSTQVTAEHRVRGRDGDWRWIHLRGRIVAVGPGGRPDRMAGTASDVTERRSLQARLDRASRLAAVGTLAAGIAHEVNNPLAYVTANLRYVEERLRELPEEAPRDELAGAVADAVDGAQRVRTVVQGLRRFAGPGGERGPVDVAAELEAAAAIARHEVARRARLLLDVAPDLPRVVAGANELGQVFVNLLVNAAQAIGEGRPGEQEVRVKALAEEGRVVVEVADSGPGIPQDVLPRIFDPFFTTKQPGAGSGLGLAICHGIVAAAGGSIQARNAPGSGAVFRIELPAAQGVEGAPTPPPPSAASAAATRRRVLVVDDDPRVGRALARLLAQEHDVEVVSGGAEALRRVQQGTRWDVVVCDLLMPDMSGMDLARALEAAAPELSRRMVFVTGGAFTPGALDFLAVRHRRTLEKPVDADLLREVVRHLED